MAIWKAKAGGLGSVISTEVPALPARSFAAPPGIFL